MGNAEDKMIPVLGLDVWVRRPAGAPGIVCVCVCVFRGRGVEGPSLCGQVCLVSSGHSPGRAPSPQMP